MHCAYTDINNFWHLGELPNRPYCILSILHDNVSYTYCVVCIYCLYLQKDSLLFIKENLILLKEFKLVNISYRLEVRELYEGNIPANSASLVFTFLLSFGMHPITPV